MRNYLSTFSNKRDSTIRFRSARSTNAADLWYNTCGKKEVLAAAKVREAEQLATKTEEEKKTAKIYVGLVQSIKKDMFYALPEDEQESWAEKAEALKNKSVTDLERTFK